MATKQKTKQTKATVQFSDYTQTRTVSESLCVELGDHWYTYTLEAWNAGDVTGDFPHRGPGADEEYDTIVLTLTLNERAGDGKAQSVQLYVPYFAADSLVELFRRTLADARATGMMPPAAPVAIEDERRPRRIAKVMA